MKKPIYKRWWFWAIIVVLVISLVTPKSEGDTEQPEPTANVPESQPPEPENTPAEEALTFELIAGEQGEYGEMFTINKDTEFEENYYIYRVPAGTYTVTNLGEYMSQITVCSDEIVVNDAGWEECAEIYAAEAILAGNSTTITVVEGSYIEIHEPAKFALEKTE